MNQFTDLIDEVLTIVKKGQKKRIAWRRHLHQNPELSFQEHDTTDYIAREIKKLKLKPVPIKIPTGLVADLNGTGPGRTIALRTDIDALPVQERTGLAYRSRRPGRMHACGHDMHMATVLGAASVLNRMRHKFAGKVRFIFQPAEEMPPGGARPMIAGGVLKAVDMILGLHVDPDLPVGTISLRDGPVMASVYDFDIAIKGRGGHAARPHTAVDAIAVASEVIESLQKTVSREVDPMSAVALSIGKIEGGAARNVIADHVIMNATCRAMNPSIARKMPGLIKRTIGGVCRARGAMFEIEEIASYPVLKNSPAANRLLERNYVSLFGKRRIVQTEMVLGGEDFACYVEKIPGAMFRLGIRNKRIGADKPWHSPEFIADEEALTYGTALMVLSALDFLNSPK
jgi:amidohydrolase